MEPKTKREMLIAREAFVAGAVWNGGGRAGRGLEGLKEHVLSAYPLPKITRPRVIRDETLVGWRVREGGIEVDEGDWQTFGLNNRAKYIVTSERAIIFRELFAHPTEEVEDDG